MKIVVIGGSGLIGSKLVTRLEADGHEVVAASRRSGVDAVTGDGLADALRGAAAVVDVSNSPSFEDTAVMKFFRTATQNLLASEAAAGVTHHVVLSVAGTDRLLKSGYFRAKFAQEKLVKESPIPYSIVRATQFFEFLDAITDVATHGTAVRVPPVFIQPIAADDVVAALAKIVTGTPLNGLLEIGGPEHFRLDELLQRSLGARNDPREVITDRHARYFGTELEERVLVADDEALLGETRFETWLARTVSDVAGVSRAAAVRRPPLRENEFLVGEVPAGAVLQVGRAAVFNVDGGFCATQATCTHKEGCLSEGTLDGTTVTCPLHGAQFNIWTGAVLRGPAREPLKTYRVSVDGDVGRVEIDAGARQPAVTSIGEAVLQEARK